MNGVILFSLLLFIGPIAVTQFWGFTVMGAILLVFTNNADL